MEEIAKIVLTIIPKNGIGEVHQQVTGLDWDAAQDVLLVALQQARQQAKLAAQQRLALANHHDIGLYS
jgi:hypothetical protein